MPLSVQFGPEPGRVTITGSGVVRDADMLAAADQLRGDPQFIDGMVQFWDMGAVRRFDVSTAVLLRLLAPAPVRRAVRKVVVAPDDVVFGVTRMYQAYAEGRDGGVALFRTRGAAEVWLAAQGANDPA